MNDLDRYIAEILRIRRSIQIYIELFTSKESIDVLNKFSGDVFGIIQRSMHDEIVISLSRLFDGSAFETKNKTRENLSQRNLVLKYESVLTERLIGLRQETSDLRKLINIKPYRDLKVAHNDKPTIIGGNRVVKHNIASDTVVSLIEKSTDLVIGIKSEVSKSTSVSVPVNLKEKYEGKGTNFVQRLKKI